MQKHHRFTLQDIAWAIATVFAFAIVAAAVVRFGPSVDLLIFLPFVLGGSAFFVWAARREVWSREERWRAELDDLREELEQERVRNRELTDELLGRRRPGR